MTTGIAIILASSIINMNSRLSNENKSETEAPRIFRIPISFFLCLTIRFVIPSKPSVIRFYKVCHNPGQEMKIPLDDYLQMLPTSLLSLK